MYPESHDPRPEPPDGPGDEPAGDEPVDYRLVARRLQEDMEGFRRRQQGLARAEVEAERKRLLGLMLTVADNLERALRVENPRDMDMWKGVALVHREFMRILDAEGVRRIEAEGKPFDPRLHEAVARRASPAPSGTVIEEIERGYALGDDLLRPARVVVSA